VGVNVAIAKIKVDAIDELNEQGCYMYAVVTDACFFVAAANDSTRGGKVIEEKVSFDAKA
jgi:hypothetical protein